MVSACDNSMDTAPGAPGFWDMVGTFPAGLLPAYGAFSVWGTLKIFYKYCCDPSVAQPQAESWILLLSWT